MKARAQHLPAPKDSPVSSMSVLVLVSHWPLTERYQEQLKALAQADVVQELILFGKEVQELPLSLAGEAKLRSYQLPSASLPLMTEAAAFEARAEVLLVLKQGVSLPEQTLQAIPPAVAKGYYFGGLIGRRNRWWFSFLKVATIYCKGLFWFHLCKGYFVSRKVYHHSGGFKQNGRLISFSELLCRQKKLSRYTYIFF
jgi:hypothetical protein